MKSGTQPHSAGILKSVRNQRAWTQRELADRLNISQALVSQIESGSRDLPSSAASILASELGVDPARLLGGSPLRNAIQHIATGWDEYRKAHVRQNKLVKELESAQSVWRLHSKSLSLSSIPDAPRQVLLRIFELEFIEVQRARLLPIEQAPSFAKTISGVTSKQFLERAELLLSAMDRLSEKDTDLLISIAERLSCETDGTRASHAQPPEV